MPVQTGTSSCKPAMGNFLSFVIILCIYNVFALFIKHLQCMYIRSVTYVFILSVSRTTSARPARPAQQTRMLRLLAVALQLSATRGAVPAGRGTYALINFIRCLIVVIVALQLICLFPQQLDPVHRFCVWVEHGCCVWLVHGVVPCRTIPCRLV